MNLKTILCIGLLLSTISLKAQYWDYVVTTKGDTVKCTINKSRSRYKAADMKRFKDITFSQISSYYSTETSSLYRAIIEPGENDEDSAVYAEVVEKGSITLYRVHEGEIDESPPLYKPGTIPVAGNSSHVRPVYS
jgi:hypothetical protein